MENIFLLCSLLLGIIIVSFSVRKIKRRNITMELEGVITTERGAILAAVFGGILLIINLILFFNLDISSDFHYPVHFYLLYAGAILFYVFINEVSWLGIWNWLMPFQLLALISLLSMAIFPSYFYVLYKSFIVLSSIGAILNLFPYITFIPSYFVLFLIPVLGGTAGVIVPHILLNFLTVI